MSGNHWCTEDSAHGIAESVPLNVTDMGHTCQGIPSQAVGSLSLNAPGAAMGPSEKPRPVPAPHIPHPGTSGAVAAQTLTRHPMLLVEHMQLWTRSLIWAGTLRFSSSPRMHVWVGARPQRGKQSETWEQACMKVITDLDSTDL
ncbi:hypothetical protein NDU88_000086 [Pleurodeles waltl]|uniref:Uncharacterized protein n=1 Tax=Pleurodeles waltl TaxID=8319 RepID=A0AAV7U3Z4_PLEWA|nr:hypothetical protein NDU88_000086 [Pleurodeles waltl]